MYVLLLPLYFDDDEFTHHALGLQAMVYLRLYHPKMTLSRHFGLLA